MTISVLIWVELTLIIIGLLSVCRPEWVGLELQWVKRNRLVCPRYNKTTNLHYIRQIRVVGFGVLLSCIALVGVTLRPFF